MKFLVLPRIVPFKFEEPIYAGVTTQISCLVPEGDAPIDITWSLHGSENLTDLGITTSKLGLKLSVLVIETTALHHRGNYTCTARNQAGATNYTATLNINGNIQKIEFKKLLANASWVVEWYRAHGFRKKKSTHHRTSLLLVHLPFLIFHLYTRHSMLLQ